MQTANTELSLDDIMKGPFSLEKYRLFAKIAATNLGAIKNNPQIRAQFEMSVRGYYQMLINIPPVVQALISGVAGRTIPVAELQEHVTEREAGDHAKVYATAKLGKDLAHAMTAEHEAALYMGLLDLMPKHVQAFLKSTLPADKSFYDLCIEAHAKRLNTSLEDLVRERHVTLFHFPYHMMGGYTQTMIRAASPEKIQSCARAFTRAVSENQFASMVMLGVDVAEDIAKNTAEGRLWQVTDRAKLRTFVYLLRPVLQAVEDAIVAHKLMPDAEPILKNVMAAQNGGVSGAAPVSKLQIN